MHITSCSACIYSSADWHFCSSAEESEGLYLEQHLLCCGSSCLKMRECTLMRAICENGRVLPSPISHVFYLGVSQGREEMALAGILIFTMLITVTHIMMIAMIGIGTFLFLLFDHHRKMGIRRQVIILLTMICGILIMGVWLVPSLSGGISSMDSEAASDVMTMWMSDLSSSLNPLNRINGDIGAFYFGISVCPALHSGNFACR